MQWRHFILFILLTAFFSSFSTQDAIACESVYCSAPTEASSEDHCGQPGDHEPHQASGDDHTCDSGCANGCGTDDCDCTCCHGMHTVSAIRQEHDEPSLIPQAGYLSPYIPAYTFEYAFSIWQPPKVS